MKYLVILIVTSLLVACGPMAPMFARWDGEADLARAEGSKKVQIEDAKGKFESAKMLAAAEVERARGVAQANEIIGKSLQNNESYLRYLYLTNLEQAEKSGTVIYVPTEAGLPILEAGKRR